MAAASLLALIDDIATLLDDVALLTKVAAKKTAGVLGDDLALNAQQVAGVQAERELPVVWAVAKGSLLNKAILVPAALAISAFLPWAVLPLLMLGGAFLCYEGVEKLAQRWLHGGEAAEEHAAALMAAAGDASVDLVAFERDKIRGAVRTDFILSAEIIVITLGAVSAAALSTQLMVLSVVALLMTVGVYGIVAGIVKLDDLGLWLVRRAGTAQGAARDALQGAGDALLWLAPGMMKALSVLGTLAMFLVGGSILNHGLPWAHHAIDALVQSAAQAWPEGYLVVQALLPLAADLLGGLLAGAVVLAGVTAARQLVGRLSGRPSGP
jgi:predicted DNA repair protein MutK